MKRREMELVQMDIDGASIFLPVANVMYFEILYRNEIAVDPIVKMLPEGIFDEDSESFIGEGADLAMATTRIYGTRVEMEAAWTTVMGLDLGWPMFAVDLGDLYGIVHVNFEAFAEAGENITVIDMRLTDLDEIIVMRQLAGCRNFEAGNSDLRDYLIGKA